MYTVLCIILIIITLVLSIGLYLHTHKIENDTIKQITKINNELKLLDKPIKIPVCPQETNTIYNNFALIDKNMVALSATQSNISQTIKDLRAVQYMDVELNGITTSDNINIKYDLDVANIATAGNMNVIESLNAQDIYANTLTLSNSLTVGGLNIGETSINSEFNKLKLDGIFQANELRGSTITNYGDLYMSSRGNAIKWRDNYGIESGKIYDDGNLNIVTNDNLFISASNYINTSTHNFDLTDPIMQTQTLRFSTAYTSNPDINSAEISNDITNGKQLMITGNMSSNNNTRVVGIWDELDVNGLLRVVGKSNQANWTDFAGGYGDSFN